MIDPKLKVIHEARRRAEETTFRKAAQSAGVSPTFYFTLCKRGLSYSVIAFLKVASWLGYSLQKDKGATVKPDFREQAETAHIE